MAAKQPSEDLPDLNLKQKSLISKIYLIVMSFDEGTTSKTQTAWEQELYSGGMEKGFEEDLYNQYLCCTQLQFKVLHRVNFSKTRLCQIFAEVEDRCD